jgi:proline dehydrogenase
MMTIFNREKPVVYNTYQLYLSDRLNALKDAHAEAKNGGYILGAKLVRGAYLEKEHKRAEAMGYPSPLQPDKAATDRDYNQALVYCIRHIEGIACCNASHNAGSALLLAALAIKHQIPRNHPHIFFAQLYGMSDNLTFNLAKAGFNAGKYVIYGAVRDVMPYLIRRAQENTAVSGDMGREYRLIAAEMNRRQL